MKEPLTTLRERTAACNAESRSYQSKPAAADVPQLGGQPPGGEGGGRGHRAKGWRTFRPAMCRWPVCTK